MANVTVRMIPVSQIHPNPDNPRHEAGDVSELARSISEEELLQPILVIPAPKFGGDHFMVEDGYRRWVAGKEVRRALLCQIRYPHPDENLAMRAIFTGLVTDGHKEHLPAMDRARAYGRLRDEFGMSRDQIARHLGFTVSTIDRYLNLLQFAPKHQKEIETGKLSMEKATAILKEQNAKNRKRQGQRPIEVGWDPDPFSPSHPLQKKAKVMCEERHDRSRRRFAGACHACWETVIRQDEAMVQQVNFKNSDSSMQFLPPAPLLPVSPDGAIRTNATPNGIKRGV